jgi:hypothetical protein
MIATTVMRVPNQKISVAVKYPRSYTTREEALWAG